METREMGRHYKQIENLISEVLSDVAGMGWVRESCLTGRLED